MTTLFTKKKWRRWARFAALAFLVGGLVDCGAAAPPVSIPAPVVTKIRIEFPDNGVSTITGEAGAVTGGNTVRAINLTQGGTAQWWEPLLWSTALAQTTNDVVANADGSFSLDIDAAIGDRIQIFQIENGVDGTPIVLTVPFQPLALTFTPTGSAVDVAGGMAFFIGNDGSSGVVAPVTLGANPSLGTLITLPAGCSNPTAVAYDPINDRLIVVANDTGAVCAVPLDGSAATVLATLTVNPVNVAIHVGAAKAVITNNSPDATVEVSILDISTPVPAFAPVPVTNPIGSNPNQTTTPVVMTETDSGTNYAVVVIEYSNGQFFAFVIDVDGPVVIGGGSLLDLANPEGLAGFNNTNGILTDALGLAHILDINTGTGAVSINNSVQVGAEPRGVAIDEANNRAYVANNSDNTLSVLDISDPTAASVDTTLDVGTGPTSVVVDTGNDQLAVGHNGEDFAIVMSTP